MRLPLGMLLLGVACQAQAACPSGKTVFECTAQSEQVIRVCDQGDRLQYVFGSPRHPKVNFRTPRTSASTYQWRGTGSTMHYSVSLVDKGVAYTVFHTQELRSAEIPHPQTFAGVEVSVNEEQRALVYCNLRYPITQKIKGIRLAPMAR